MYKNLEKGRSMIEMLGVLAIIAVLSVGGIAGYSKAMEKYKINKTIEEYSALMTGLIEYKDNFIKNTSLPLQFDLDEVIFATQMVPETWKPASNKKLLDSNGNILRAYFLESRKNYVFDLRFTNNKTTNSSFANNLCAAFFKDLAQPLSSQIEGMYLLSLKPYDYMGDNFCRAEKSENNNDAKCLRDISLAEINNICKDCTYKNCSIAIVF